MKLLTLFLLLLMPLAATAQNYQGMSEADMNKMMKVMEEMQKCMEKVDQSKLKELEKQTDAFESEIAVY